MLGFAAGRGRPSTSQSFPVSLFLLAAELSFQCTMSAGGPNPVESPAPGQRGPPASTGFAESGMATAPTVRPTHNQELDSGSPNSNPAVEKTSSKLQNTRSRLGLHPVAPIDDDHDLATHQDLLWSRIRLALREPFAEFLGTFILVLFGNGSVAQVLLSTGEKTAPGE